MHTRIENLPICVDLDGTLVITDTLYEALLSAIKHHPLFALRLPFLLLSKGRAYVKREITKRVHLRPDLLPYTKEFLAWLMKEKANGRILCLATASDYQIAQSVADHLKIFDRIIASDGTNNLAGAAKAEAIVRVFGQKKFVYAGNSKADLEVWPHADAAIIVNASSSLTQHARKITRVVKVFSGPQGFLVPIVREIRVHQWVKNILLFVPILTAHMIQDSTLFLQVLAGFAAFSAAASAVYVVNDVFDIEADRRHLTKKNRPIASGMLPLSRALQAVILLVLAAFLLAAPLPAAFTIVLVLYMAVSLLYSLAIKRVPGLDVITLASLYVLRIFAGSAATGIMTSAWLFVFAAFLFMSLALVKRYSELENLHARNKTLAHGRGYASHHRPLLLGAGLASGYVATGVLALYTQSESVLSLYTHPSRLLMLPPLFFLWVSRVWFLTYQGKVHEDPTVFATKDWVSYVVAIAALGVMYFAT